MAHTSSIMDAPIKEINIPVMKPIPYTNKIPSLGRLARNYVKTLGKKAKANAKKVINRFADWILSLPNEPIRRGINDMDAPLRGFLRTYRIDGIRGRDQNAFANYIRPRLFSWESKTFPGKVYIYLQVSKGSN